MAASGRPGSYRLGRRQFLAASALAAAGLLLNGCGSGLGKPDWQRDTRFSPLPDDSTPPEWRNIEHGLNSMDLLVNQKLGGENAEGRVEWVVNEQLMIQLPDPNTVRVRWNITERDMEYYGWTEPRLRLAIWRW